MNVARFFTRPSTNRILFVWTKASDILNTDALGSHIGF